MLRADPHNVQNMCSLQSHENVLPSSCNTVDDQLTGSCGPARLTAPPPALGLWSRRRRRRTRAGGCCLCGGLGLLASGCHRVRLPLGVACWQLAPELLGETLAQRSAIAIGAEAQHFAAGAQTAAQVLWASRPVALAVCVNQRLFITNTGPPRGVYTCPTDLGGAPIGLKHGPIATLGRLHISG
jgi:hypothetical protein